MTGVIHGGDAEGDTFSSIENLTGSAQNDTLEGDSGNNVIAGGAGIDTITYEHAAAVITVSIVASASQNTIGAGRDALSGFENLTGSVFDDTLAGNRSANVISGLAGNDLLNGGGGADTLIGGDGNDSYVFNAITQSNLANTDTIFDFLHAADQLDVSAIDANASTGGNQAFAFGGQNATVLARTITWFESGRNTIIQADVNGNATADFVVVLTGINHNLTAADFIL